MAEPKALPSEIIRALRAMAEVEHFSARLLAEADAQMVHEIRASVLREAANMIERSMLVAPDKL